MPKTKRHKQPVTDPPRLCLSVPFQVPDYFQALDSALDFSERRSSWKKRKHLARRIPVGDAYAPTWTSMPAPPEVPWLTVNFDPTPDVDALRLEMEKRWEYIANRRRSEELAHRLHEEWQFDSICSAEDRDNCVIYELARESATIRALVVAFRHAREAAMQARKAGDAGKSEQTNVRWNALFWILLRVLRGFDRLVLVDVDGFPERPWLAYRAGERPRLKSFSFLKVARIEPAEDAFLPHLFGTFGHEAPLGNRVAHFSLTIDTGATRNEIMDKVNAELREKLDKLKTNRKHSPSTSEEMLGHLAGLRLMRLVDRKSIAGFNSKADESSRRRDARKVRTHLHSVFALPEGEVPITPHLEAEMP